MGRCSRESSEGSTPKIGTGLTFQSLVIPLLAGGLLGKLSGIARELIIASVFGTSAAAASLRVAQTGVLVPANLIASDALNSGFVPLFVRARARSVEEAERFYRSAQVSFLCLSMCLTIIVEFAADELVNLIGPGLSVGTRLAAAVMLRVMALAVPLFVWGSLNSYLMLSLGDTRLFSIRATFQNLSLLAGVVAAAITHELLVISWAFVGGNAVYVAWSAAYIRRRRRFAFRDARPNLREAFRAALPLLRVMRVLLIVPLVLQVNEVLERAVASLISENAVPATDYASFIQDTSIALLAAPLGLAGLAAMGQRGEDYLRSASDTARKLTPAVLAIGIPVSLVLGICSTSVVTLIYSRGAFDHSAVRDTSAVLSGFGFGVWAQVLGYVLLKLYGGVLRPNRLALITVACLGISIVVLLVAGGTKQLVLVGLAGSAYGLACVFFCSWALGLIPYVGQLLLLYLPPSLVTVLILLYFSGSGVIASVLSWMLVGSAWGAYCFLIPAVRRRVLLGLADRGENG